MNQKFFDPEDDGKIPTKGGKASGAAADAEGATLPGKLLKHMVEAENEEAALADGGPGFPLPAQEDENGVDKRAAFAQKDLEYPELQLIVCKKGVVKAG